MCYSLDVRHTHGHGTKIFLFKQEKRAELAREAVVGQGQQIADRVADEQQDDESADDVRTESGHDQVGQLAIGWKQQPADRPREERRTGNDQADDRQKEQRPQAHENLPGECWCAVVAGSVSAARNAVDNRTPDAFVAVIEDGILPGRNRPLWRITDHPNFFTIRK